MISPAPHLLLGRRGDLTALLPALYHKAQQEGRPQELVVSKDYADFLDGVSYVRPIVFPGSFDRPRRAKAWFGRQVVDCSVYGVDGDNRRECLHFDRDIHHKAGTPHPFGTLPLVFDRRDPAREAQLVAAMPKDKPIILVSLSGTSAPFPEPHRFIDKLTRSFPDFTIFDVSTIPLHRPYDMLAWMEKAYCIISCDSLPLHLSRVSGVPTIALLTDLNSRWESTAWRSHHRLRLNYREVGNRWIDLVEAVEGAYEAPHGRLVTSTTPNPGPDVVRRLGIARKSREREMSLLWLPELVLNDPLPRNATDIGEQVPLPYIRDLIEQGLANGEDFVAIANADISFTPGLTGLMFEELSRHGATWAHRWDFSRVTQMARSEAQIRRARWYPGCDFFAMTRGWWKSHGSTFPDMVLGREAWDLTLRHVMRRSGADEIHLAIYHERHESPWEVNRDLPGNVHNRRLAQEWMDRYGGNWRDWEKKPVYKP